jgi:phosphatidylglycerol:prolipoprotein diacylglycerol transferase
MTPDQFGIHIGPLYLRFYGLILVTGAFLGGYLASLEAKRKGHNPDLVWDAMLWALLGGILGARLWHILTPPPSMVAAGRDVAYYLNFANLEPVALGPWTFQIPAALALPNGGLGIPGAVAGGVLAIYLYTHSIKVSFSEWIDFAAPAIALGQAIGRWGNYFNQELYGAPTTLPWGLTIDAPYRVAGFTDPALRFHPTFLYESIGSFIICLSLLYIARHRSEKLRAGDLFLIYLLMYPVLRFFLEFIRLDSSQVFKLNANQTLMVLVFLGALGWLISRHGRRNQRAERRANRLASAAEVSPPPEPSTSDESTS